MKVLVDADALIALAKSDDTNHEKAVVVASKLSEATLYVAPLTIPEAATILSYRVSQQAAKKFLVEARRRKLIEMDVDASVIKGADEVFLAQKRKGISWIDCMNVALYKANKLDGIFSFDRFYKKMGLKLIS